jgi:hypothetical protein
MLKLETLTAHFATPVAFPAERAISDPTRVVIHPTLAQFHLSATAVDCLLALIHLILPALTNLHVDVISEHSRAEDVQALIPYFVRNAYGPQDIKPLQSMSISGGPQLTEIISWTEPDADLEVKNPLTLISATLEARAIFTISGPNWRYGTDNDILEATLAALPMSRLTGLTVQNTSRLSQTLWLDHAPRWPSLERVRLVDFVANVSFAHALTKDAPRDGPLLPSLTKLCLIDTSLIQDGENLFDMLVARAEQGVPLETLDLRACIVTASVVRLLSEITVYVECPETDLLPTARWPTLSNWSRDIARLFHREDDDDDEDSDAFSDDMIIHPWFDSDSDEDEAEDEAEDEDDDGGEDGDDQL